MTSSKAISLDIGEGLVLWFHYRSDWQQRDPLGVSRIAQRKTVAETLSSIVMSAHSLGLATILYRSYLIVSFLFWSDRLA
jgi:hypothetical protein